LSQNKDFSQFKKYFKGYQDKFGLNGYRVYFKHESLDGDFACIDINQSNMVAVVSLNSKIPIKEKPFSKTRRHAKHEALHLLVGRLEKNGRYRYSSDTEMYEATEELVRKLEGIIKG